MSRPVRVLLTLVVTALGVAYLVWKVDISQTLDILAEADPWYFLAAVALMIVTVWPMALRWKWLLHAKGIDDTMSWLTRAYFVSYAAGQILPTSIGGDAVPDLRDRSPAPGVRRPGCGLGPPRARARRRGHARTGCRRLRARRRPVRRGRVPLARVLLRGRDGDCRRADLLAACGPDPRQGRPLLRPFKLDRLAGELWSALHSYRDNAGLLIGVFALTLGLQAFRVLAIWCSGKAVGIEVSPRVYYVMGPLLFVVMLVPFTINGLAVREAFFVSFLGNVGVGADEAFAAGSSSSWSRSPCRSPAR